MLNDEELEDEEVYREHGKKNEAGQCIDTLDDCCNLRFYQRGRGKNIKDITRKSLGMNNDINGFLFFSYFSFRAAFEFSISLLILFNSMLSFF